MNSLAQIFSLVAVVMSGMAIFAWRRARLAGAHCLDLELLVIDADLRLDAIETQILRLMKEGRQTAGQVDRLAADKGRLVSNESGTGYGEAIALIQHGASADQLINTCGISRAEAHLVETLYGQSKSTAPSDSPEKYSAPNKFILVDAHLEVAEHRPEQ